MHGAPSPSPPFEAGRWPRPISRSRAGPSPGRRHPLRALPHAKSFRGRFRRPRRLRSLRPTEGARGASSRHRLNRRAVSRPKESGPRMRTGASASSPQKLRLRPHPRRPRPSAGASGLRRRLRRQRRPTSNASANRCHRSPGWSAVQSSRHRRLRLRSLAKSGRRGAAMPRRLPRRRPRLEARRSRRSSAGGPLRRSRRIKRTRKIRRTNGRENRISTDSPPISKTPASMAGVFT